MISRFAIEAAYAFFHQKLRVYQYSNMDWQKDDIEYAIDDYTRQMDSQLYQSLSCGRQDYLRNHTRFAEDLADAVEKLESKLKNES